MIDAASAFLNLDLAALQRRRGNKWSKYPLDVLPAWVADMDFPLAPCIEAALHDAIRAGDVGYPDSGRPVAEAFAIRAHRLWNWTVSPDRVYLMPDVVQSVELLIERFSQPGDGILIMTPIYPPFLKVTTGMARRIVENPLLADGSLDYEGLQKIFADAPPRLVLLCSPHNPTGHVFRRAELACIVDLAKAAGALIISDEIHAELTYPGNSHIPIASLSAQAQSITITVTSASKPFNIAGLRCAQIISGTREQHAIVTAHTAMGRDPVGILGSVATLAAWTPAGDEWLGACRLQLAANMRRVAAWAAVHNIGFRVPEATYLAWLDFTSVGLGRNPAQWLLHHAHVAVSPGVDFGGLGDGHCRLNVATSPHILDLVLGRMSDALAER